MEPIENAWQKRGVQGKSALLIFSPCLVEWLHKDVIPFCQKIPDRPIQQAARLLRRIILNLYQV
jgi:hypothetical protein